MDDALATVRGFNRFYTKFVGALDPDFLGAGMSLPEARVLFEMPTGRRRSPPTSRPPWTWTPAI
jgi:hypothetical protein